MATIIGTSIDESLDGTSGIDTINGNGGNDRIAGLEGRDWLYGGAGDDRLYSYTGLFESEEILGTGWYSKEPTDSFQDVDRLFGGANNDKLFAGYGDHVDGGQGIDILYINFLGSSAGVTADFRLMVPGQSITIGGGTISGVEHVDYIIGSAFDDFIAVNQASISEEIVIDGGDGNDHLIAILAEGIYGQIIGGDGDDILDGRGGYAGDYIGGEGDDTIYTNMGYSSAQGGDGDDTIYAYSFAHGDAGNDIIVMGAASDVHAVYRGAFGGEGDDHLSVDLASSMSDDEGFRLVGDAGADVLIGGAGNDSLESDGGAYAFSEDLGLEVDRLNGGAGDDIVSIGYGDFADGGEGQDRLILSLAAAPEGVELDIGLLMAGGPVVIGGGTIVDFESVGGVNGTSFGDRLVLPQAYFSGIVDAGAGDDLIVSGTGFSSSAFIFGGDGNDRFEVRSTATLFDGGGGIDTIDFSFFGRAVEVVLTDLFASTFPGPNGMRISETENIIGSGFDDLLTGNSLDNLLVGNAGDDSILAGLGNDELEGGAGNDHLQGEGGTDTARYTGNRSDFTITQLTETRFEIVDNRANGSANLGTDILDTIEAIQFDDQIVSLAPYAPGNTITGTNANDTISPAKTVLGQPKPTDFGDTIYGNAGNDMIDGGKGGDRMVGGLGNDTYTVDNALDNVEEAAGGGTDKIQSAVVDLLLAANVENGTLLDVKKVGADLDITGNALANVLNGNAGANSLSGLAGKDKLNGKSGVDILTGGAEADQFVFDKTSVDGSVDTISDFSDSTGEKDKISLSAIDADGTGGAANGKFAFIGTAVFGNVAGQLRYEVSGGNTTVQADIDGDGMADLSILLLSVTSLVAGDFVL